LGWCCAGVQHGTDPKKTLAGARGVLGGSPPNANTILCGGYLALARQSAPKLLFLHNVDYGAGAGRFSIFAPAL